MLRHGDSPPSRSVAGSRRSSIQRTRRAPGDSGLANRRSTPRTRFRNDRECRRLRAAYPAERRPRSRAITARSSASWHVGQPPAPYTSTCRKRSSRSRMISFMEAGSRWTGGPESGRRPGGMRSEHTSRYVEWQAPLDLPGDEPRLVLVPAWRVKQAHGAARPASPCRRCRACSTPGAVPASPCDHERADRESRSSNRASSAAEAVSPAAMSRSS